MTLEVLSDSTSGVEPIPTVSPQGMKTTLRQRQQHKEWRDNNWEQFLTAQRERRKRNRIVLLEQKRAYYQTRKETNRLKSLAWYYKNWERSRAQNQAYIKKRLKNDPIFKLVWNLRGRIHSALSGKRKAFKTIALLGCSPNFLRSHLETAFKKGHSKYGTMTWENYGSVWHVDHIRPCASFDLSNPEQQKECFHYSNLQPLFATENLQKGASWDGN